MDTYLWPGDTGWPGAEAPVAADLPDVPEEPDPTGEIDLDALSLHAAAPHVFDDLTPLERSVLAGRFGLDGHREQSMKELHADLGLTRHQVRDALESGLAKLRSHLV